MDHSWRPPVPGTTTVCPICSISHFPFCLPPTFIQNPRFHHPQPQPNYPPQFHPHPPPPPPLPFPNHQTTSINYYYNCNPIDIRRPTWYGSTNPTFNPSPYDPRGYDNGGIKRMKIEPNNIRVSSDNERILKLIHDHGNGDTGFKGPNSFERFEPYSYGKNSVHYDPKVPNSLGQLEEVHHGYGVQPPLPASPPPPPPIDVPPKKPSLFPVSVSSSSSASAVPDNQSQPLYYSNNASRHAEEFHIRQSSSAKHARDIQPYPLRRLSSEEQNIVDASHIFKQPHRASRPDHFVIILRGLPGSGKSYLAKVLRDIEVENGGEAPRIHSMDEYFMIEVEKAEESELSKSSGSLRGKRQVMKTVMEYCYEPEMEESYRASMLKAFKKTLDEGVYSFIIVDDRNLRVADFAQFWATAKRSGYEVYLVEASYKDPAGCAARNVHNFTLPDIQKMAGQWEEAPSLYLKMDIKSLLHGHGRVESDIQEVDMDMEDEDAIDASQNSDVKKPHDETKDQVDDFRPHDEVKDVTVANHQIEEVKDLSRSKWSNDFDAEEEKEKNSGGALSGLVEAYSSKEAKSVSWGDQGGNVGFSISATRKTNTRSLVIGPGPGYNLKSNPLSEEEYLKPAQIAAEPSTQSVFQEQIRAERQSFKAVFDKRRQRIGGFNIDDE